MDRYRFLGDRPYLERAARDMGRDPATIDPGPLRLLPAFAEVNRLLTALSNLDTTGQAAIDSPDSIRRTVDDCLARAQDARDRIDLALRATDMAIADARAAFPAAPPESAPEPPPPSPPPPAPEPEPESAPAPGPTEVEEAAEPPDESEGESRPRRGRRHW